MRIWIGKREINISPLAELRVLAIVYREDRPEPGDEQWRKRPLTHPGQLILTNVDGEVCTIDETGAQCGALLPGVYDVTKRQEDGKDRP